MKITEIQLTCFLAIDFLLAITLYCLACYNFISLDIAGLTGEFCLILALFAAIACIFCDYESEV